MTALLVGDIGGTKSEFALLPSAAAADQPLVMRRYANADFCGFDPLIKRFLAECGQVPPRACLAVAGIVAGDRAQMTNLSWELDRRRLEATYGFRQVALLNDLTAVCSALPVLRPADLLPLQPGDGLGGPVRGVVAPGTGLGEGLLVEMGQKLFVRGSQGGHSDFAPVDGEQQALLGWLLQRGRPVSYETVIAGPGLSRLYDFCRQHHGLEQSSWVEAAIGQATDPVPAILAGAIGEPDGRVCPLCRRALDLFLAILGSEAGNLALKLYAKGGIYLGGGILPRLVGRIDFSGLLQAFRAKGQMAEFMQTIPLAVILKRDAALAGAAHYAAQIAAWRDGDGG